MDHTQISKQRAMKTDEIDSTKTPERPVTARCDADTDSTGKALEAEYKLAKK
jgi:hypothetical protein